MWSLHFRGRRQIINEKQNKKVNYSILEDQYYGKNNREQKELGVGWRECRL